MPAPEKAGAASPETVGTTATDASDALWNQAMGEDPEDGAGSARPATPTTPRTTLPAAEPDTLLDEALDPEEDEDTDSEDRADEETVEDAESEAKEQAEDPDPVVFTVKLSDGTTQAIRRSDAESGYLRHADYTRKTMEVAEHRKQLEAQKNAYAGVLTAYQHFLQQVQQPDFERIKADQGTEAYLLARAQWQDQQEELRITEAESARIRQEQQEQQVQQIQAAMQEEAQRMRETLPGWKDERVAERESAAIRRYLSQRGFEAEEIAQVRDHRIVKVLRDAALYAQMQAKAKGKVRPAQRTLKPGTTTTTNTQVARTAKAARQKLRDTGDAGDYFEAIGLLDF